MDKWSVVAIVAGVHHAAIFAETRSGLVYFECSCGETIASLPNRRMAEEEFAYHVGEKK